ncbi:hypothetical protein K8R42_00655, partial [bacterium]|nr:hypothetical protein [bacterium]
MFFEVEKIFFNGVFWLRLLEFLDIIVWPAVVILFILFFRDNIKKLIDRIERGKILGNEFVCEQKAPPRDKKIKLNKEEEKKAVEKVEAVQKLKDNQTQLKESLKNIVVGNATLRKQLLFEKVYNIMFGTQVKLLEDLRGVGARGLS